MKKPSVFLFISIILISVIFASCNGAEGGKVTDRNDDTPVLTQLETELSSMADMVTDVMPDMSGNITDNHTTA